MPGATKKAAPTRTKKAAAKKKAAPKKRAASRRRSRYAVVYDIEGPKVRLGFLWFVVVMIALNLGIITFAAVYAIAAAGAAAQTSRCWQSRRGKADALTAAAIVALVPIMAIFGEAAAGLAVIALPAAALVTAGVTHRRLRDAVVDAGFTVQSALFVALATGALVLLDKLEIGSAASLVFLVSAYEVGDYLVGTGANNHYEGPFAGDAAVLVTAFTIGALEIPPFGLASAMAYGVVAMVLIPIGQLVASAILPKAGSKAPALRRLDSLLIVAPAWYLLLSAGAGL